MIIYKTFKNVYLLVLMKILSKLGYFIVNWHHKRLIFEASLLVFQLSHFNKLNLFLFKVSLLQLSYNSFLILKCKINWWNQEKIYKLSDLQEKTKNKSFIFFLQYLEAKFHSTCSYLFMIFFPKIYALFFKYWLLLYEAYLIFFMAEEAAFDSRFVFFKHQ